MDIKTMKEEIIGKLNKAINDDYMPEDIETGFIKARDMIQEYFEAKQYFEEFTPLNTPLNKRTLGIGK